MTTGHYIIEKQLNKTSDTEYSEFRAGAHYLESEL